MATPEAGGKSPRASVPIRIEFSHFIRKIRIYVQQRTIHTQEPKHIAYSTASTEGELSSIPQEPEDDLLWHHPSPRDTQLWEFLQRINSKYGEDFRSYRELHRWSVESTVDFWGEVWDYCGIRHSSIYEEVIDDSSKMWPRPSWFVGARMNFAENLLYPVQKVLGHDVAVIAATETERETVTWLELRGRVRACQASLRAMKLEVGDRVAGYVANHSNALVIMLATVSLGGIWTAISPDTGVTATLDRLIQIEPKVLFTDNAVIYNGKTHDVLPKLPEILTALLTLHAAVILPTSSSSPSTLECAGLKTQVLGFQQFLSLNEPSSRPEFLQLPGEHPVFILFSSGTTGVPKCIVHGAIGTLIQHKKEHVLQSDIRPCDRLLYITTCMWMMWHWFVSGLASGATIILYNGSPFHYLQDGKSVKDELAMPKIIDELHISQFGASAKYFSLLQQKSIMPKQHELVMDGLKAIYSTGSPLAPSTFRYIYDAFGQVNLGSISGGTDIISDFGTPSPISPVYAGEIQVIALGLAVRSFDSRGRDISDSEEPGELVCVKPFPSQPVQFWGPSGVEKYKASYFEQFPGVWAHGDFIKINPRTGGLVMLGRSDGVLNPSGVRFGSAEIYNLILKCFPDHVEDSLCIGRRRSEDMDETVILFVKMRSGQSLSDEFVADVTRAIREELSPRHVPAIIDECPDIPVTANGKKIEVLVKKILSGMDVEVTGSGAVDVKCVEWYKDWAMRQTN